MKKESLTFEMTEPSKDTEPVVKKYSAIEIPGDNEGTDEQSLRREEETHDKISSIQKKLEQPTQKENVIKDFGKKRFETLRNVFSKAGIEIFSRGAHGEIPESEEKLSGKERVIFMGAGIAMTATNGLKEFEKIKTTAGKALPENVLVGKSVSGIEKLAKIVSIKNPNIGRLLERTANLMKKHPEIVEKSERLLSQKIKDFLENSSFPTSEEAFAGIDTNLVQEKSPSLGKRIFQGINEFFGVKRN